MNSIETDSTAQPGAAARRGLLAYFAGNPVAANLLMLVFIVTGVTSA